MFWKAHFLQVPFTSLRGRRINSGVLFIFAHRLPLIPPPSHLTTLPPLLPPFSNNTWNAAPINVRVCIKGREGHVISDLEWRIKFVCNNEVIWSVTFLWPGLSVCRSVSRSLFSKISEYLFPMRYVSITYNHGTFTLLTFFVFIHRSLKLLRIFLKLLFFDRKQCKTPDTYL